MARFTTLDFVPSRFPKKSFSHPGGKRIIATSYFPSILSCRDSFFSRDKNKSTDAFPKKRKMEIGWFYKKRTLPIKILLCSPKFCSIKVVRFEEEKNTFKTSQVHQPFKIKWVGEPEWFETNIITKNKNFSSSDTRNNGYDDPHGQACLNRFLSFRRICRSMWMSIRINRRLLCLVGPMLYRTSIAVQCCNCQLCLGPTLVTFGPVAIVETIFSTSLGTLCSP